jgi:hypothetical protein
MREPVNRKKIEVDAECDRHIIHILGPIIDAPLAVRPVRQVRLLGKPPRILDQMVQFEEWLPVNRWANEKLDRL